MQNLRIKSLRDNKLIDQVTRGNRDSAMQDILNTLDGGDTKDMNVITVFTTNHIELIEPTFLRGKRIGTVITLDPLDAKTAEKFIRNSFKASEGYLLNDEGIEDLTEYLEGQDVVPAFMAEICEAVKANLIFAETGEITMQDIKLATHNYLRQIKLSEKKDMSETPETKLFNSMKEVVKSSNQEVLEIVEDISERL